MGASLPPVLPLLALVLRPLPPKLLRLRFQQSLSQSSANWIPKRKRTLRRSAFRPLWRPFRLLWPLLRLLAPRTLRTSRTPLPLVANLRGNCRQLRLPQLRPRPLPSLPPRLIRPHLPPGCLRPFSPLWRNSPLSFPQSSLLRPLSHALGLLRPPRRPTRSWRRQHPLFWPILPLIWANPTISFLWHPPPLSTTSLKFPRLSSNNWLMLMKIEASAPAQVAPKPASSRQAENFLLAKISQSMSAPSRPASPPQAALRLWTSAFTALTRSRPRVSHPRRPWPMFKLSF